MKMGSTQALNSEVELVSGPGQIPDTHYPISGLERARYATVRRVLPDGEIKRMYPIFDRPSAERALYLLNRAKPFLSLEERKAVVDEATKYF